MMGRKIFSIIAFLWIFSVNLQAEMLRKYTFDFSIDKFKIERKGKLIKVFAKSIVDNNYYFNLDSIRPYLPLVEERLSPIDIAKYDVSIRFRSTDEILVDSNVEIATQFPDNIVFYCSAIDNNPNYKWKRFKNKKVLESMSLCRGEQTNSGYTIYINPFRYDWKTKKLYLVEKLEVEVRIQKKVKDDGTHKIKHMRKPKEEVDSIGWSEWY